MLDLVFSSQRPEVPLMISHQAVQQRHLKADFSRRMFTTTLYQPQIGHPINSQRENQAADSPGLGRRHLNIHHHHAVAVEVALAIMSVTFPSWLKVEISFLTFVAITSFRCQRRSRSILSCGKKGAKRRPQCLFIRPQKRWQLHHHQ